MTVHEGEKDLSRVLIVEDEALLALDLEQSLSDFGYEVIKTVRTGNEAIQEALQTEPDLILMDINLPGQLDGIDAYYKIREEIDVPVVYLTGYSEEDVLERAKKTEPYGYLAKPIGLPELRNTLETALYKHKADKRVRESEFRYESFFESWPVPLWEENWSSVLEHLRLVTEKGQCSAREAVKADPGLVAECASRVRFGKINKSALRLFGASSRENFPHDLEPLLSNESLLDFKNQLLAVVEGKRIFEAETKRNLLSGGEIVVLLSMAAPFDRPTGDVPLILSVTDITDRKRAEQELRESHDQLERMVEERTALLKRVNEKLSRQLTESKRVEKALLEREALIRSISDNLPSGMIYQVTGQRDGSRQFTYLSEKVKDFYGCSPEEAMAEAGLIYGRIHPEDRQRVFLEEEEALESLSNFRTEVRMIDLSGDVRWSYFASSPKRLEDGSTYWSGLEIDITDRKRAEEALLESEQHFRDLYENLRDGMAEVDGKGRFVTCNPQFLRMLGYSFDELSELTYKDVTPARWHAMESRIALEQIDVRGYSDLYEKEYIHKNGTIFPAEIQTYLAKDRDGRKTGYWAFARDISDRKKDEEELRVEKEFTDNALNSQRDTFFLFDPSNGRAIRWNRAFNDITGYTDEEIATMPAPDSYYSLPDLKRAGIFIREVLGKGVGQIELDLVCKDGHKVPYEYICSTVKDLHGKVKYLISMGRDITERKKAEEQIKASLREKESLLREIHHRVKNNLAVVSSLLRLQSRYTEDETVRSMFEETEARIRAMALAHAQLYQTKNLLQIESGKYLGSLLASLRSFMGQLGRNMLVKSEFEDIDLQIDTAIPLGFIVTELVSNVFKHAFPEGRRGELKLSLHRVGENDFELVVKDDGVGIPGNIDPANPKSCGLTLVDVFVRQICGTMEVRRVGGTEVRIRFATTGAISHTQR